MYGDSKASIGSLFGRDGDGRPDGAVGRGLLLTPREVQTETATGGSIIAGVDGRQQAKLQRN